MACDMIIAADNSDFGYPEVPVIEHRQVCIHILQRLVGRMRRLN